jgi:hypothetical protein
MSKIALNLQASEAVIVQTRNHLRRVHSRRADETGKRPRIDR